jgi:4-amino-4-deoxy-L-arabinose transferase-like glycosyltransferase
MDEPVSKPQEWNRGIGLLLAFAITKVLLHLVTSPGYGYFRDEFYYLACSDRLALGYVDQPPLSIFLLSLQRTFLGDSLPALRFLPAVAGGITVLLTGLMARQLGGNRFAQVLAMLAVFAAPIYLGTNHVYSMNSFNLMFWAWAAYLLIRLLKEPKPYLWLLLGLALGLGLQNKIAILWLGFGFSIGFLFTSARRYLLTPWPWITAVLAGVIFLPHILWQIQNDWPTIEFMRNATGLKMVPVPPLDFLVGQIRSMNPVLLPIWLSGLIFFFFARGGRDFRLLGWTWLAVFVLLMLSGTSRAGYMAPGYTWLFAGGAVAIERLFERFGEQAASILETVASLIVLAGGIALAPLALPVLPVESYIAYAQRLGGRRIIKKRKELAELPQFYADMHG